MFVLGHWYFLERSAVGPAFVNQVQGNPRRFFRRSDLALERYRLRRTHFANLHDTDGASVTIVKMGHQSPGIKNSKCAGQCDTAIFQALCSQWAYDNSRVRYSMEFISRSSREPFRVKAATLAWTKAAHRAVEFGFEIVGAGIRIGA